MNAARQSPEYLATILLLLSALLWSSAFVAAKIALTAFDPLVLVFGRMLTASLVLLPFWKRLKTVRYQAGDWKYLCFMALCEPCLFFVFEANALRFTTAAQAGMITATLPLFVTAAAVILLGERVTRRTLAGFALVICGVAWLSWSGEATKSAPNPGLGNILEILAMFCAAGYMVTAKHLSSRYSPQFLTAFQAVAGAIFFLPLIFMPFAQLPQAFPLAPTLSILYLGTFATLGAYGCYNYGVSKISASRASIFINLIPVFTIIFGWLFLGEVFTFQQSLAAVLVLGGVFISQKG